MASVFSPQLVHLRLHSQTSTTNLRQIKGSPLFKYWTKNLDGAQPIQCSVSNVEGGGSSRREAMGKLLFSVLSFPLLAVQDALAETAIDQDFRVYEDEKDKFRITVPRDWVTGVGDATGFKSITAFFPQEASDSNVSPVTIAITGLGPDFTRLESFGNVDAFAESLVSGLDRSWTRPSGLAAKLVNSKASNGFYYIEYTLQNPGEKRRHIFSAIGLASNGKTGINCHRSWGLGFQNKYVNNALVAGAKKDWRHSGSHKGCSQEYMPYGYATMIAMVTVTADDVIVIGMGGMRLMVGGADIGVLSHEKEAQPNAKRLDDVPTLSKKSLSTSSTDILADRSRSPSMSNEMGRRYKASANLWRLREGSVEPRAKIEQWNWERVTQRG